MTKLKVYIEKHIAYIHTYIHTYMKIYYLIADRIGENRTAKGKVVCSDCVLVIHRVGGMLSSRGDAQVCMYV